MPPVHNRRQYLPLNERIKNGRIFAVNKRTQNGVIYLRCSTKHCRGTAKKLVYGDIITSHAHSIICYEDTECQLKADFLCALKTALKRNFWKLKVVYETVAAMFPPNIKVLLPFNTIKSSLKNWRKCMFPPNPTSLEEMARQLIQPESTRLLEYDVGRIVCQRITDTLGKVHLLLFDPEFVRSECKTVSRLFVDATFQTTPRLADVYQMLTVLGVIYDHVSKTK